MESGGLELERRIGLEFVKLRFVAWKRRIGAWQAEDWSLEGGGLEFEMTVLESVKWRFGAWKAEGWSL